MPAEGSLEPPAAISLSLHEALELVGTLEDARDALWSTNHVVEVALVEAQIDRLNRRLGYQWPEGDDNGN